MLKIKAVLMEKKFKKIFDEASNCLNWEVIMNFYEAAEYESTFIQKKRNQKISKDHVKKELMKLVNFVLTNETTRFEADQWIIIYKNNGELGNMLEIIFCPTKGCAFEKEPDCRMEEEEADTEAQEQMVLKDMLDKSVEDENYELSAVLRDRIKRIDKSKHKSKH